MTKNRITIKTLLLTTCIAQVILCINKAHAGVCFAPESQDRLAVIEKLVKPQLLIEKKPTFLPLNKSKKVVPLNKPETIQIKPIVKPSASKPNPHLLNTQILNTQNEAARLKSVVKNDDNSEQLLLLQQEIERLKLAATEAEMKYAASLLNTKDSPEQLLLLQQEIERLKSAATEANNSKIKSKEKNSKLKKEIVALQYRLDHPEEKPPQEIPEELELLLNTTMANITQAPKIDLGSIDNLLDEIKESKNETAALILNDGIIKAYQDAVTVEDEEKLKDIESALQKLMDNGFIGKVLEEQSLKDLQKQIREVANNNEETFNTLKSRGDGITATSPNSILLFLKPDCLNLVKRDQWIEMKKFLKFSPKEDLAAILHYLTKIAKVDITSLTGEGNPLLAYLLDVNNQFNSPELPKVLRTAYDRRKAGEAVNQLRPYMFVDFIVLENKIGSDYAADSVIISNPNYITAEKPSAPLLRILELQKPSINNIVRGTTDLILEYTKYLTIQELKAIVHHLAELKIFSSGTKDSQYLARSLDAALKDRIEARSNDREIINNPDRRAFEARILPSLN